MIKKLLVLLVLCLISCSKNQEPLFSNEALNQSFFVMIDDYIDDNPLIVPSINVVKDGLSYPSYHLYVSEKINDTIISIVLSPHLNELALDEEKIGKEDFIYKSIKSKGYETLVFSVSTDHRSENTYHLHSV